MITLAIANIISGITVSVNDSVIDLHHYSSEILTRRMSSSSQSKLTGNVEKHLVFIILAEIPTPPGILLQSLRLRFRKHNIKKRVMTTEWLVEN